MTEVDSHANLSEVELACAFIEAALGGVPQTMAHVTALGEINYLVK